MWRHKLKQKVPLRRFVFSVCCRQGFGGIHMETSFQFRGGQPTWSTQARISIRSVFKKYKNNITNILRSAAGKLHAADSE